MTKKTKDQSPTDFAGMLGNMPFNPMNDPQLKAWSDLGAEMMQFAASRIQRDLEAQKAMLACKSLEDLQKVQAEFYSEAIKDYNAQIQRTMQVMSGAAKMQVDAAVSSTKRGYDDVPL
ncbi:phasin family protein [Pseudorhodobacter ferrugineus]|uniref:phasin family protein n=1 Tax=Pseudorhodobacter ferrugineus TaxID=77008 RepID=UPI0003B3F279|nr:phasin family protein [Pseudorhodobacter ferrugineus]